MFCEYMYVFMYFHLRLQRVPQRRVNPEDMHIDIDKYRYMDRYMDR